MVDIKLITIFVLENIYINKNIYITDRKQTTESKVVTDGEVMVYTYRERIIIFMPEDVGTHLLESVRLCGLVDTVHHKDRLTAEPGLDPFEIWYVDNPLIF